MYTVMLGTLKPKTYATTEEAYACRYLDARRFCSCFERPCGCARFEEFKALLDQHGAIQMSAAIISKGEYTGRRYHVSFKKYVYTDPDGKNHVLSDGQKAKSFPDKQTVEARKSQYPQGARVELISMSDPYTHIPPGTRGTVTSVDDTSTVFVRWDTGSGLGAVYGVDEIKLVDE